MKPGLTSLWPLATAASLLLLFRVHASAELPTGYLVWSKGEAKKPATRKIYRMTLPQKNDIRALTSGEDVEGQISPDGKWIAYAKAKQAGVGSDYHSFNLWKVYLVSIHGIGQGREEIKIDDDGYWPSWGDDRLLYYNKVDPDNKGHVKIIRVELDEKGRVTDRQTFVETKALFPQIKEVNEGVVAPDGSWFAARTRGAKSITGVGAFSLEPPKFNLLARAGSFGCMPQMAPSGEWALIAGADYGIRYGDAPGVDNRKEDQTLIPLPSPGLKGYHPGVSTDEQWALAAFGSDQDHNAGEYDVSIYRLDSARRSVGSGELLASGGFNGWPHVWVGQPSPPPPPQPSVDQFYAASYTLLAGSSTLLHWQTSEAQQVNLNGTPVQLEGSQQVAPAATTMYRLTASNTLAAEPATSELELTVVDTPQSVVIERFDVAPQTVGRGESARLSWTVRFATTLNVNLKRVAPSGTMEVTPSERSNYVLTANGLGGDSASATVQLEVTEIQAVGPGQLPDRGGFVCSVSGEQANTDGTLMLLALLAAARTRAGRRRRRSLDLGE